MSESGFLDDYRRHGLAGRLGFGRAPAIVVVDLIVGFTDPASPLGSDLDVVVSNVRLLLDWARSAEVPILFTTTAYQAGLGDAGLFPRKVPSLAVLEEGSRAVEVDPRLGRRAGETLIVKKYASAFFGTVLAPQLVSLGVDTLIITGATTSGCVRATAVDALQHGFRPVVPRSCVGDRSTRAHEASLFDIEAKYGDVVDLESLRRHLEGRRPAVRDGGSVEDIQVSGSKPKDHGR